ncbi:sesquiterpene synthase 2 isoform X3 [Beta vulgaris subsp. vulgaris]|uniref:sesquiterpene synthase 2 isoform X3 n=1 Tax=Beta vulgaris subsp. vulgaris TaxID=3555 RepID=UPI0020372B94|nr:sesquiterpene synthase 2 isoform X3 [Beta vulgaris subsp. vulgaris]
MDPSASLQGHTDNGEAVPLANYHPDIWSDVFSDYTPLDQATQNKKEEEVIVLIEEVRKELLTIVKDPKERLLLVDAIQRLGVAYYFEEEIEANLKEFYKTLIGDSYKHDLHFTSLRFRLLRQHGFYESCDVFVKYKDENGSFKDCLTSNVHGILSLYEASHLRLRGESVLDDAFAFSMTHLSSLAPTLRSPMAEQIANALKRPLYKCTTRLEAKYQQISLSESNGSHFQALLKLAKSDFNLLQLLHKKELSDIIRWSRRLDFKGKFSFARDRVAEPYIWSLGIYYEPKYSFARMIVNKVFKLITVVDDMYDAYGTIDELEAFTEAILRWDESCMNELPDYMKLLYQIILDTFQEFQQDLANEGRSYAVFYLQNEFEQKREHVSSAVECYMANFSVSEEEAYEELLQQVEEAWKDLKAEIFRSTAVPMPLLMQILNMSRALYDVYHIGADGFTVSECMKEKIEALLIDTAI